MRKYLILFILTIFTSNLSVKSQNAKVDSLETLLKKTTQDTSKASILAQIGFELKLSDPEQSLKLGKEALELSLKTKYKTTEAAAYNVIGIYHYLKYAMDSAQFYFKKSLAGYVETNNLKGLISCYGNISSTFTELAQFDSAIYYQQKGLEYSIKINNEKGIANAYHNLGNTYNLKGDYNLGIENLFKALKLFEKQKDEYGKGMCYYNIGRTYYMQGKHEQGVEYSKKCRVIREKLGDKSGVAITYILEGGCLHSMGKNAEAATIVNKAIEIQNEIGDRYSLQYSYSTLANIFYNYKQFDLSIEYYQKSREIAIETNNKQAIATIDYSIGAGYSEKGDYKKALEYQTNSINLSKELGLKEELKNSLQGISQTYAKMKNYDKAYQYVLEYIAIKDSLLNEGNSKQLNELATQYETDKKQKEIELLTKDQEVKNERIARQNIITYTVILGLLLMIVLAFISFKRYREKKKANIEITQQKEIIEEKQREIIDSIKYAKRIQQSLLPTDVYINKSITKLKK
ncbi:MAG: tetratricopeptide repeat protein [Bacteroidia bacterium]|nr:tetratricopeptide repeat protein [Bacteroidia bacterium]